MEMTQYKDGELQRKLLQDRLSQDPPHGIIGAVEGGEEPEDHDDEETAPLQGKIKEANLAAYRDRQRRLNQLYSEDPLKQPKRRGICGNFFEAGGICGSLFTMLSAILGAGLLTLPFAVYINGLVFGPILIIVGAMMSYYTGYLLCLVGEKYNKQKYEDIAMILYGKCMSVFSAICVILTLLGVVIAYIVLVKALIPQTIQSLTPNPISGIAASQPFWATVVTYGIVFPLSLLKNMSSLRFTSVLGFVCICYISLLVFVEYFIVTTDIPANWGRANVFQVSIRGIFGSFPLIIFSFLYQPNIPAIYTELKHKSLQRMDKVLVLATIISVSIYVLVGIFGYVTFADLPVEMEKVNILAATPYMKRVEAQIGYVFISFAVLTASPVCVKPVKDSFQILIWKGKELTGWQNFYLTFILITACWLLAVFVPLIMDVISVLGSTVSPIISFSLPVIFWLKVDDGPRCSGKRCFAHFINVVAIIIGLISLTSYILGKFSIQL